MDVRWLLLPFLFPLTAAACDYPDEGTMPLHRAVTKVKLLPETEAWATPLKKRGVIPQYELILDHDMFRNGRCYWTVDARAEGKTWRRFYVTPSGASLLNDAGQPRAEAPSKATGSAEATAAPR